MIMLTFEKVLEVFGDYIEKDTVCEVITAKQGYTVMYWDVKLEEWYGVTYCKTPEVMRDTLLESYSDYLEQSYTQNRRNLIDEEQVEIKTACEKLYQDCD